MHVALEPGNLIRHRGHLYFVEQVTERHKGQQKPSIHIALREALDDRHVERTLDELEPIEHVPHAQRSMQYLYSRGTPPRYVFMDNETFEETEMSGPSLQGFEPFLREGDDYRVLVADDKPLRLLAPANVELKITDTAAPTHSVGGAGANILKEASLENGLTVRVPLFLKTGDVVRIDTRTREYLGKAGK
jgi:elongation factor P